MQKNPQNPDCFLQLPTFQNILKLHRETQDFFSTELSSVPLTLLGAKTKSCSFKVHRCSGDWKYKWDSSERHVVTLRERVWLKKEPERKTQNQEDGSKVISSKIILKGKRPFKLVDRLLKSSQIQTKLTWWFWQYFHFCSEKKKSTLSES